MELVIDRRNPARGGYAIFEYTPTLFRLFYKNYRTMTFRYRVRFLLELIRGYKIYYLSIDDEITAYCVISRGGGRYKFAGEKDIVVGPYFVREEYRGNRYSELLVRELLQYDGIRYEYAYDWINKRNERSLRCSKSVGFNIVDSADIVGLLRRIKTRGDLEGEFYILRK